MKSETKYFIKIGPGVFLLYLCIYYWSSAAGLLSSLVSVSAPLESMAEL